jgi:hypothetical protein
MFTQVPSPKLIVLPTILPWLADESIETTSGAVPLVGVTFSTAVVAAGVGAGAGDGAGAGAAVTVTTLFAVMIFPDWSLTVS